MAILPAFVYALNLSYPPEYTLEVLQNIILEMDGSRLFAKAQALKTFLCCWKLFLAWGETPIFAQPLCCWVGCKDSKHFIWVLNLHLKQVLNWSHLGINGFLQSFSQYFSFLVSKKKNIFSVLLIVFNFSSFLMFMNIFKKYKYVTFQFLINLLVTSPLPTFGARPTSWQPLI